CPQMYVVRDDAPEHRPGDLNPGACQAHAAVSPSVLAELVEGGKGTHFGRRALVKMIERRLGKPDADRSKLGAKHPHRWCAVEGVCMGPIAWSLAQQHPRPLR